MSSDLQDRMTAAEYRAQHGQPSEHQLQRGIIQWARAQAGKHPELGLLHAIPNGQYRPGQRKEPGLLAGMPDLCLPAPRCSAGGRELGALYLELKKPGRYARKNQRERMEELRQAGNAAAVARSLEEAQALILEYLGNNHDDPLEPNR